MSTRIKVTPKQEKYCQNYVISGRKSASYRLAYCCDNMKPESVNRKAFELHQNVNVTARIEQLREKMAERNRLTTDKLVDMLSEMASFDPADAYNEDGTLKAVEEMPRANRLMLAGLESDEWVSKDLKITTNKKIKHLNRNQSIDQLLRVFGAYEKDNAQRRAKVKQTIDISKLPTDVLLALKNAMPKADENA